MNNIVFSVIVPAFCAEKTIAECLNSILDNNRVSLEVIVVDDGSTDNTAYIVNQCRENDKRVRCIQKENGGLSSARNAGVIAACGQYLVFVDSDDCLVPGALDRFAEIILERSVDIVVGDVYFEKGKIKRIAMSDSSDRMKVSDSKDFLKKRLITGTFWTPVWFNIYRTDFIRECDLRFREGIYLEDDEWTIRVFLAAEKVLYSGVCLYRYIIRESSIMRQKDCSKHVKDGMEIYTSMRERYASDANEGFIRILNGWIAERFLVLYSTWPKEFWKMGIKLDDEWIIEHAIRKSVKCKAYLYHIAPRFLGRLCLLKHAL